MAYIEVFFSGALSEPSVNYRTVRLVQDSEDGKRGAEPYVIYDDVNQRVVIKPEFPLDGGDDYTLIVSGILDVNGRAVAGTTVSPSGDGWRH